MTEGKSGMDMTPFERRFNLYGLPLVLLGFVLLGIWRFSEWVLPRAETAITTHFQFVKSAKETQERLADSAEKQAENGATIAAQQIKISEILDRQERRTSEIADRLKDVHSAVLKPTSK